MLIVFDFKKEKKNIVNTISEKFSMFPIHQF